MWQFIASVAVTLIATFAIRPKTQNQPPPAFEDLQVPTAEDGKAIPVLFGCRMLRGPNVVWYGDFRTTAIRVKGGKK